MPHDAPSQLPPLLGVRDLADRWKYTPRGVRYLIMRDDFPPPAAVINAGRTKAWLLDDIKAYEHDRPELGDEEAKRRKILGYYLARQKGPMRED